LCWESDCVSFAVRGKRQFADEEPTKLLLLPIPYSLFPAVTDTTAHTASIAPITASDKVIGTSIHRAVNIFSAIKASIAPNP